MVVRRPRPTKIRVRKAEEKDRRTLFKWMGDANHERKGNWSIEPKTERSLPLSEMFVAADGEGKLLGTAIVDRQSSEMLYSADGKEHSTNGRVLHGVYVPKKHRGFGADRELVKHVVTEAEKG